MKRVLLFYSLLFALPASSQTWMHLRNEVYFGLGASNFLGELGGANQIGTNGLKDFEFSMTKPGINLGYRYIISPYFAGKIQFNQAFVSGNDALTQEPARQNRNLSFKSPISEVTLMFEYYPFREKIDHIYRFKGAKGKKAKYLSPYFTAGFGALLFNPKAKYQGKWVELQPLHTEGQGLPGGPAPYKKYTFCIPVGFGLKYGLSKNWSIGFEISGRKTFTDYMDDVSTVYYDNAALAAINPTSAALADPSLDPSNGFTMTGQQRGDPTDKDSYMFAIFSVHYRFLKYRMHLPKFK